MKKLLKIMKLTSILLLFSVFSAFASKTYSQTKTLNVNVENATVKEVLSVLEDQSEFYFMYSSKVIDVNREVSLDLKNKKIDNVLDNMFANTNVNYTIKDRIIVLTTPEVLNAGSLAELQQKSVSGKVTDENGNSLPGVTVLVKGTMKGTITDAEGKYSLLIDDRSAYLVFSFIGYVSQDIPIDGKTTIDVLLVTEVMGLNEVVIIGYGFQRKATLTGSISNIKGATIEESASLNISNSIAGRLSGVVVLNRSGEPGNDETQLLIRGISTLGSSNPLIVIDGVAGRGGLNQIDPRDIESISVLKDASAAIYGSRAANGVILVTTKRGSIGKPVISYSFSQGITQPTRVPDYADAATLAEFQNEQLLEGGQSVKFTPDEIEKFRNGTDPINYPNTDWIKSTLKDYSTQSRHSLAIRGGSEDVKYYVSANLSNQDGIFKNGISNYKTLGIRSNIDLAITENIQVSLDLSSQEQDNRQPSTGVGDILENTYRNYPYLVDVYPNGLPGAGFMDNANPQVMVTDAQGYRDREINLYQTKATIKINVPQIHGLDISGFVAYDKLQNTSKSWEKPYTTYRYNSVTDTYTSIAAGGILTPRLTESSLFNNVISANAKIAYTRTFKNHRLNSFAAIEQSTLKSNDFSAFRKNFISSEIDQLFAGGVAEQVANGSASESARRNVFGRLSYGYLEKYLFDINMRYDGSSSFPEDSRWGFFPGVSVGWIMSEESFIQNSLDFVNHLKLRASVGKMGNDAILPFQYLSSYSFLTGALFGNPNVATTGIMAGVEANPYITWEVANTANIGLDASLWNDDFGMTVDVFKTTRSNILTQRNASIPQYSGLILPLENIGIVENKGIELTLSHKRKLASLNYSVGGNVSFARNTVIDIDEAATQYEWQTAEGHSIGTELYYTSLGIYRTQQEIDNSPHPSGTRIGDLQYQDTDKNGEINDADRVRLDKTSTPEIVFGMNFDLQYRQFYMSALLQGQARSWQYYFIPQGLFGNILVDMAENRPSTDPANSKYPNLASEDNEVSAWTSDFWLRDTKFIRLKNLELGYNLPKNVAERMGLMGLRLYVNGFNLFTIDKLKWFDPEGNAYRGVNYPQNKIYNFGVSITF